MYQRYGWEDFLVGSWVGLMIFLVVVGLVAMAWATVKAVEVIVRAFVIDPWNKALWVAAGGFLLAATLAASTAGQLPVLNALVLASGAVLLLVAKIVEIYHEQLLLQDWSKESLSHALLHEPWWSLEAPISSNGHLQTAVAAHG